MRIILTNNHRENIILEEYYITKDIEKLYKTPTDKSFE